MYWECPSPFSLSHIHFLSSCHLPLPPSLSSSLLPSLSRSRPLLPLLRASKRSAGARRFDRKRCPTFRQSLMGNHSFLLPEPRPLKEGREESSPVIRRFFFWFCFVKSFLFLRHLTLTTFAIPTLHLNASDLRVFHLLKSDTSHICLKM